jgi:dienelactone hydrolase
VVTTPFGKIGRIEAHPIRTLTLSDEQFLSGRRDGQAATIAGELRLPVGEGPFPAVVLMHGSGGVGGNVNRWSMEFVEMGVAAFIVDCFSGRGIRSTIADQSQLGGLAMIYDAYRALEVVSGDVNIDARRIVLMGFSKGGFAALYASLKRFQRYYAPRDAEYWGYLPFYARCDIVFSQDEDVADRPIRMFHGEADDWVPFEPARQYVARLRAAGKDVELTTYPGVRHSFDSTTYPPAFRFEDAEISSQCRLAEREGQIVNLDTGKPFTHHDACITRGATVGSDPAAYERALATVQGYLRAWFSPTKI